LVIPVGSDMVGSLRLITVAPAGPTANVAKPASGAATNDASPMAQTARRERRMLSLRCRYPERVLARRYGKSTGEMPRATSRHDHARRSYVSVVNEIREASAPLRVVQWTTGNVGERSVIAVLANRALELVGCYAWSPDKVGRDVGELCGVAP